MAPLQKLSIPGLPWIIWLFGGNTVASSAYKAATPAASPRLNASIHFALPASIAIRTVATSMFCGVAQDSRAKDGTATSNTAGAENRMATSSDETHTTTEQCWRTNAIAPKAGRQQLQGLVTRRPWVPAAVPSGRAS